MTQSGTALTGIYGVGIFVAARILAEVVDIGRYPTRHTFAAANGSAPIPASSGRTVRHRLNRGGNRQLNRALYTIAITEIRAAIFALSPPRREGRASLRTRVIDLLTELGHMFDTTPRLAFSGALDLTVVDELCEDVLAVVREGLSNVARHAGATALAEVAATQPYAETGKRRVGSRSPRAAPRTGSHRIFCNRSRLRCRRPLRRAVSAPFR